MGSSVHGNWVQSLFVYVNWVHSALGLLVHGNWVRLGSMHGHKLGAKSVPLHRWGAQYFVYWFFAVSVLGGLYWAILGAVGSACSARCWPFSLAVVTANHVSEALGSIGSMKEWVAVSKVEFDGHPELLKTQDVKAQWNAR